MIIFPHGPPQSRYTDKLRCDGVELEVNIFLALQRRCQSSNEQSPLCNHCCTCISGRHRQTLSWPPDTVARARAPIKCSVARFKINDSHAMYKIRKLARTNCTLRPWVHSREDTNLLCQQILFWSSVPFAICPFSDHYFSNMQCFVFPSSVLPEQTLKYPPFQSDTLIGMVDVL